MFIKCTNVHQSSGWEITGSSPARGELLVIRRTLNLGAYSLIGAYFLPVLPLLFEAHLEFRRMCQVWLKLNLV